jgi:hypothetical protein
MLVGAAIDPRYQDRAEVYKRHYAIKQEMVKAFWQAYLKPNSDDAKNPYVCYPPIYIIIVSIARL